MLATGKDGRRAWPPSFLIKTLKRGIIGAEALVKRVVPPLVTRTAAWNMPRLIAALAHLTMQNARLRRARSGRARWHVLLLPRSRFIEDSFQALSSLDNVSASLLPRKTVKAIAAAFLPDEVDDNDYVSTSADSREAMLRYREFLKRFWLAFDPRRKIHAVFTGNFGYYAERELGAALEELGIPFVALHKENSWSPGTQSFWEKIYKDRRGPFHGRRILVYSPIERDLQLRSGVITEERVEVVGMARLDEVHQWRQLQAGLVPEPVVLFVSFHPDVSMPVLGIDEGSGWRVALDERPQGRNLLEVCLTAHQAMVELARLNPDITVFVKSKGRDRDLAILNELLGVRDESELPSNLKIVLGGSPLALLFQSAVVCGLHSTLLVEAIAAGRPVVMPWYGELTDPEIARFVFDLGTLAVKATSPDEFKTKVRSLALARTPVPEALDPDSSALLREWVGNEDGRSGERTAAAILRVLEACPERAKQASR